MIRSVTLVESIDIENAGEVVDRRHFNSMSVIIVEDDEKNKSAIIQSVAGDCVHITL